MRKSKMVNLVLAVSVVLAGVAFAAAVSDIDAHKSCKYCGMDRGMFNFSRMLVEYEDGSAAATCSLHCMSVELANSIDKTPKLIQVGDFNTKQLINAEKASWVIGGTKPGVMSKRGKWAFAKKEDAEAFIKTNNGSLTTFEEAIKAAYLDTYEDTKTIREKRKMKRMQMMEHK